MCMTHWDVHDFMCTRILSADARMVWSSSHCLMQTLPDSGNNLTFWAVPVPVTLILATHGRMTRNLQGCAVLSFNLQTPPRS